MTKPVIASLGDVAGSGGYMLAMAANAIVAESLTLAGSIGVVSSKFNMQVRAVVWEKQHPYTRWE